MSAAGQRIAEHRGDVEAARAAGYFAGDGSLTEGHHRGPSPRESGRWSTWLERAQGFRDEDEFVSDEQERRIDQGDGE